MKNSVWMLFGLCCACGFGYIIVHAAEPVADTTRSVLEHVPLTPDAEQAKQCYAYLMHAVYLQTFQKDMQGAKKVYNALVKLMPESAFVWYKRGQLKNSMQDVRGAEQDTRRALSLSPSHIPATWQLAQILLKRASYGGGKYIPEALETLKNVITLDPDHLDAHHTLAEVASQLGDFVTAETSLKVLTRLLPFEPIFHQRLGHIYKQREQTQQAIDAYQRVIKIRPEDLVTLRVLGELYLQVEDLTNAQDVFQKILDRVPQDFGAMLGMGLVFQRRALQVRDNTEDTAVCVANAEEYMLQALATAKAQGQSQARLNTAYTALANTYLVFKKPEKSLAVFEEMLENAPDNIDALFGLGAAYQTLGNFEMAETYLRKTLQRQPNHAHALNGLGYLYAEHSTRLDEAETLIKRALQQAPENGAYLDSLGWVFFRQGRFAEAVETLEHARQQLPEHVDILMHLGDAYHKIGETQKAERTWKAAQKLDPDNSDILERLRR